MNPTLVIWILAAVVAVLLGREVGKWAYGASEKLAVKKRAAQKLSGRLREAGLKLIPSLLEDFAVGDVNDMLRRIEDVCKIIDAGSDAIEKELQSTFDAVLTKKLASPEGLAYIKGKALEAEQAAKALEAAK